MYNKIFNDDLITIKEKESEKLYNLPENLFLYHIPIFQNL